MNNNRISIARAVVYTLGFPIVLGLAGGCALDPSTTIDEDPPITSQLAACAGDGRSLEAVWSVDNGHGAILAQAMSNTGEIALAGTDGVIKTWIADATSPQWDSQGSGVYGSEAPIGIAQALGWSQDGHLVAGDGVGQVALWDMASGMAVGSFINDGIGVTAVASNDDASMLAVINEDFGGQPRFITAQGGTVNEVVDHILWGADDVAFHADGDLAIVAGHNYGTPAWFSVDLVQPDQVLSTWNRIDLLDWVHAITFDSKGGMVAVSENALLLFDAQSIRSPESQERVIGHDNWGAIDVAVTPDDAWIIVGTRTGLVHVLDSEGQIRSTTPLGGVVGVHLAPDGETVVAATADGLLQFLRCMQ